MIRIPFNQGLRQLRGFTLIELIVVIVVITIIAGITMVAYRGVASDYRMTSAKNTVSAALDNARARAIRDNEYMLTVFRPRLVDSGQSQVVDVVVARWSGDSQNATVSGSTVWTVDRFVPVVGIPPRTLSTGVSVAGPGYGVDADHIWWAPTFLPAVATINASQRWGAMAGILYSPEGRVVVRNAESGSDRVWVDFDQDGEQTIDPDPNRDGNGGDAAVVGWATADTVPVEFASGAYFDLQGSGGEPFVSMAPFLCVFDEQECRAQAGGATIIQYPDLVGQYYEAGPDGTVDAYDRDQFYTDYIDLSADRIQFNRYSGVPLE